MGSSQNEEGLILSKLEQLMDAGLEDSMRAYYDERAGEYEELYTLGTGPASISDPNAYKGESAALSKMVAEFAQGELIDVGCGTGFWLPHYAPNCSRITLLDQSGKMLCECRKKAQSLGIEEKCTLIQGDFFSHAFLENTFDTAIVGFFLSHVPQSLETNFFDRLRRMLKPIGRFLILDSIWSGERAKTRSKAGRHKRTLNDGRDFEIYKRYFDANDFQAMAEAHKVTFSVVHAGRVFIVAEGRFPPEK